MHLPVHRPNGGAAPREVRRAWREIGDGRARAIVTIDCCASFAGACGVGVLLARRCPGKRHGALPRRPRRIALRRFRPACARRLALLLGRCMAASVGAAVRPLRGISRRVQLGAQGRGSVGMRLAARGHPGIAGVVPGSVTGLCPSVPGRRRAAAGQRRGGGRKERAKIWNCQNKRSMVSLVSSYKPSVTALHKRIATVDSPQK